MPAQQLRNRLDRVFSDEPWRHIAAHGGSAGHAIPDIKTMVVHETSGWLSRNHGREMFRTHFLLPPTDRVTSQLYISGDGTVLQGMQLPNNTQHAGFLNNQAIGSETAHGWGNYRGEAHLGPFTSTNETQIPDPNHPGHTMDEGSLVPPVALPRNHWLPLSGNGRIEGDDVPGIKFWAREHESEVAVGIWTTARYTGPWRQPQRFPEMLFTEGHYRAWALLARWIAEEYLLPRNFPLLPHKLRTSGRGDAGNHSTLTDAATFSSIVLADEGLSRSPQTFGLSAAPVPPTAAALRTAYAAGVTGNRNRHWQAMFNVYRGFHGHGYCGDPVNGDHDCPGPMFDWHRFAREVWDWWWWPFDFDTAHPDAAVAPRPYSQENRDGDTPLKEYFWSTPVATPRGRARNGIHGARSTPQTFELPENSRIYALANGELIAARFPTEVANQVSLAFMVVRHEVYHQQDARAPNPAASPPVFANRIDYNLAPTTVYSLYMHLGRPTGMSFTAVDSRNPDWLNRVLARKKEARLGADFRTSAVIDAAKWNDAPPGSDPRPTLAAGWTADNDAVTGLPAFLNTLSAGNLAIVPLDADATPIRILLGDYLGNAGVISRAGGTTLRGVRVEVFSNTLVSNIDFTLTDTSATTHDFTPQVGTGSPAVRYPSEWARTPAGAEKAGMEAAGVPTGLVNWWLTVQVATLHARFPPDAALFALGHVIHYDPLTFLPWLNRRTWRSEWPKYRVTGLADIPAAPRPR